MDAGTAFVSASLYALQNDAKGLMALARPTKWRKIENIPEVTFFVPAKTCSSGCPRNTLLFEELEAIRLKDKEGLEQEECAKRMQVSRPTFQRILLSAREKVADSLISGKAIHIEGGNYTRNICPVKCAVCGREWTESYENLGAAQSGGYACPFCGSVNVFCGQNCRGGFRCRGWRRGAPK